ncbi:MAG: reeler domain-containing protein [Marinicellaceae bacterium]
MTRIFLILLLFAVNSSYALPSGAPVCEVFANFDNITGMTNRVRNTNTGDFTVSTNMPEYNTKDPVEITISGTDILGLMFTVVDSNGNSVGQFSPDSQVDGCGGNAMSITHSQVLGTNSKILFWIPPETPVGSVFIEGYVLSGITMNPSSQNFYRFVSDDNSAFELLSADDIFSSGFESIQ